MKSSVCLKLNGERVRTRRELPEALRGVARRRMRWALSQRRIRASGIALVIATAAGTFIPQVSLWNTAGAHTETIPSGATTMTAELFGATGGGAGGTGTGCSANNGTGGGSGGYSKTIATTIGHFGQTIAVSLGTGGAAGSAAGGAGGAGTASTLTGGTFSLATMTCNSGSGGINVSGSNGGTASGGVNVNTTGNGTVSRAQAGGVGIAGVNATGFAGGAGGNTGTANPGVAGATGKACFGYV